MDILTYKLIASFFVGGTVIAGLSLLAEKAHDKIAGAILSMPSTVVINFIFISWTLGPERLPEIIPPMPLTAGIMFLVVITYLYISRLPLKKPYIVILSAVSSLSLWFLLSIPLAIFEFNHLGLSILGYLLFVSLAYYLITIRPGVSMPRPILHYTLSQKISRALISGGIVTLAVYLANTLGPFWGGVFSFFPATYFSTLLLLHTRHSSEYLFRIFKNTPIGFLPTISYVLISSFTYPNFGILLGTLLSYLFSLGVFLVIYWIQFRLVPALKAE